MIRRLRGWLFARREQKATEFLRDPAAVEEAKRRAVEALPDVIDLGGAFDVEPVEAMRCGAEVGGFRCTRPLGHEGRCWSTGWSEIAR